MTENGVERWDHTTVLAALTSWSLRKVVLENVKSRTHVPCGHPKIIAEHCKILRDTEVL